MTPDTVKELEAAGLSPADVDRIVRTALEEDFRYGPDVTSMATVGAVASRPAAAVPGDMTGDMTGDVVTGDVVAREHGVLAGVPVALAVLDAINDGTATGGTATGVTATVLRADGSRIGPGDAVLRVSGPATAVLGAERTLLNFLTHLSGIATATRAWADAIADTGAVVRDTRKTLPGLRALQKYAVRRGGGENHRLGLGDAALIKDNHVAAAGGIAKAIDAVRAAAPDVPLEVECDTLDQVREALDAGARFILLDNMPVATMRTAVAEARRYDGVRLEASGGLRLANAREVAATGVDYLSVGALTHSVTALDLGLDLA